MEGAEFASYELKYLVDQWYKEWEISWGVGASLAEWEDFSSGFLNHFFSQELRKERAEEFMNLRQSRILLRSIPIDSINCQGMPLRWWLA